MIINKVYVGWVINAEGEELKIIGSMKVRGKQIYVVKNEQGEKQAFQRESMLAGFENGSIEYVRSEAA